MVKSALETYNNSQVSFRVRCWSKNLTNLLQSCKGINLFCLFF